MRGLDHLAFASGDGIGWLYLWVFWKKWVCDPIHYACETNERREWRTS